MTLNTPLWMQPGVGDPDIEYAAIDWRQVFWMTFNQPGVGNSTPTDLKVSQRGAGADFSVDVAEGVALVLGGDVSDQGFYFVHSTATENVAIPTPPGTGTRTHRVVAQVKDKLHNSTDWSTYEWAIDVLEDTGSGTPATPDSALSLATVSVAAGQVSVTDADITDTRQNVVSTLGLGRYIGPDSDRPPVPWSGELIWRTGKLSYELYDGTSWREIPHRDGGGSEWTTYTPALTATTTSPTLGTGSTAQGRYIREGRRVTVEVIIKFGTSGAAAGSGFYEVSLPVTARTQTIGRRTGSAYTWDDSVPDFADGVCFIDANATTVARLSIDSTVVTNAVPWTWAASDELGFTITYEAAS